MADLPEGATPERDEFARSSVDQLCAEVTSEAFDFRWAISTDTYEVLRKRPYVGIAGDLAEATARDLAKHLNAGTTTPEEASRG